MIMNRINSKRMPATLVKYVLPVVILAGAVLGARALVANRPSAVQRPMTERAALVEVMYGTLTTRTLDVEAMGDVLPARRVDLRAQVGGRVRWRHSAFEAGGRFAAGEVLLEIEREDYEAALMEAEAVYAQARRDEALERQRQAVAIAEWRQSGNPDDGDEAGRAMARREPYAEAARRVMESARAGVERAQRNLERTRIRAPFDAVTLRTHADTGSVLAAQTVVAELAGLDRFHVHAALPPALLAWIDSTALTTGAAPVRVSVLSGGQRGPVRIGRAVRVLGDLSPQGLMARLLIEVDQPLQGEVPLLLGAYAHCVIEGRRINDVIAVPRRYWRDGGTLWVADPRGRLEIRTPAVAWAGADEILVSGGLSVTDRIITTTLPVAVAGMELTISGDRDER